MKKREKMHRVTMAKVSAVGYRASDDTSCPAGAFDTAAALDAKAAIIRNRVWSNSIFDKSWDSDQTVLPEGR